MTDQKDIEEIKNYLKSKDNGLDKFYQLQEKQLDYLILYVDEDLDTAKDVHEELKQQEADGCLFDENSWPFEWKVESGPAQTQDLCERCSYVLVVTSNNWACDGEALAVKRLKEMYLEQSYTFDRRNVIPLFKDPREETGQDARANLWGLMAINGVNLTPKSWERSLQRLAKLLNSTVAQERKAGRAENQRRKFEEFLEEKRAEMEEEKRQEAKARQRSGKYKGKKKDNESAGSEARLAKGNITYNNVNIYGANVTMNQGQNALVTDSLPQQREGPKRHHVPQDFWRQFADGTDTSGDSMTSRVTSATSRDASSSSSGTLTIPSDLSVDAPRTAAGSLMLPATVVQPTADVGPSGPLLPTSVEGLNVTRNLTKDMQPDATPHADNPTPTVSSMSSMDANYGSLNGHDVAVQR